MESIPEIINGLPNISGWEDWVRQTTARGGTVYLGRTPMRPERIQSAFAVALHMHQPVILYNHDLRTAPRPMTAEALAEAGHPGPVSTHDSRRRPGGPGPRKPHRGQGRRPAGSSYAGRKQRPGKSPTRSG